jgi:Peptidase inhibitor family I36
VRRSLLMLASVTALLLVSAPVDALAAGAAPSSAQHCVAQAIPVGSTAAPVVTCYPTFAQSIRAATAGRVSLPASAVPGSVTPDQLNAGPLVPNTTYVLSIDYAGSNFTGSTLAWTQSSKCGSFQASSMPSGWNDVVSSVAAYSNCANTLYQNNNFGGSTYRIGENGSAGNLGSMNNQTSSEKWS